MPEAEIPSIIVVLLSLLAVAFFSSSEASLISVNKFRVKHLAEQGDQAAGAVLRVVEHHEKFFATILLTENAFIILASSVGTALCHPSFGEWCTRRPRGNRGHDPANRSVRGDHSKESGGQGFGTLVCSGGASRRGNHGPRDPHNLRIHTPPATHPEVDGWCWEARGPIGHGGRTPDVDRHGPCRGDGGA